MVSNSKPDEIIPELLKTAEMPISMALHQLFLLMWKSGKVPADWKDHKVKMADRRLVLYC